MKAPTGVSEREVNRAESRGVTRRGLAGGGRDVVPKALARERGQPLRGASRPGPRRRSGVARAVRSPPRWAQAWPVRHRPVGCGDMAGPVPVGRVRGHGRSGTGRGGAGRAVPGVGAGVRGVGMGVWGCGARGRGGRPVVGGFSGGGPGAAETRGEPGGAGPGPPGFRGRAGGRGRGQPGRGAAGAPATRPGCRRSCPPSRTASAFPCRSPRPRRGRAGRGSAPAPAALGASGPRPGPPHSAVCAAVPCRADLPA